jgi:hypothetical protein
VPISVRVTGPGAGPKLFHAEVARNRRLTPMLASLVVQSALTDTEPDVADMVVTVVSKLSLKGHAPLELRDEIFSGEGVSRQALAGTRGLRAVGDLLFNTFEPVVLDRIDVDIRVEFRRDIAGSRIRRDRKTRYAPGRITFGLPRQFGKVLPAGIHRSQRPNTR